MLMNNSKSSIVCYTANHGLFRSNGVSPSTFKLCHVDCQVRSRIIRVECEVPSMEKR